MSEIWCNGRWQSGANHPAAAQDRGAFLGLGLFETMLAVDGRLVFAERHMARLAKSCERLGWTAEIPAIREIVAELLEKNQLATGRARVRLVVTAGSGPHDDLTAGADRVVWLAAFPVVPGPESIGVCISPWPRNERSPLAGLKTACYAENLIALDHARRLGFEETIFLNTAGHVCEAATANLFIVRNGALLTPPLSSGCLPGIGREIILELAADAGLAGDEKPLLPEDLSAADEMFLSSATRGPVPVSRIETRVMSPGPVVAELKQRWEDCLSR